MGDFAELPNTSQSFHWAVLRPFGPQTLSRNCVSFLDTGGAPIWNLSVFRSHRRRSRCLQWNVHCLIGKNSDVMGIYLNLWDYNDYNHILKQSEKNTLKYITQKISVFCSHPNGFETVQPYPKLPMALPMVGLNHQSDQWIEGGSPANIIGS